MRGVDRGLGQVRTLVARIDAGVKQDHSVVFAPTQLLAGGGAIFGTELAGIDAARQDRHALAAPPQALAKLVTDAYDASGPERGELRKEAAQGRAHAIRLGDGIQIAAAVGD